MNPLWLNAVRAAAGAVPSGTPLYTVTTTGAQTHNIASLGVSAAVTVYWGDGNSDIYTGTAARSHAYAGAGTWVVSVDEPLYVTTLSLSDNKITLNSSEIAAISNVNDFRAISLKAGTFDSADVVAWRPSYFWLLSMPAGYAGTFDSADVSAWRPSSFYLHSMPAGYAGTFDSADVSAWRPSYFWLLSMPAGYAGTFDSTDVSAWRPSYFFLHSMPAGYAGTFDSADVSAWRPSYFYLYSMPAGYAITAGGGFADWSTITYFLMQNNGLLAATVDAILWELYQASAIPRTASGGTINISGSNAAPSGTYQAAASCPVTVATPGKEIAHELKNDGCAVGFNKWATVTTS